MATNARDLRAKALELSRRQRGQALNGGRFPGETLLGEFPNGRLQVLSVSTYPSRDVKERRHYAIRAWIVGPHGERWPIRQVGLSITDQQLPHLAALLADALDIELARAAERQGRAVGDDDPLPAWAQESSKVPG